MRAKEFIQESRVGSMQDDVADALPATYVIPKLQNQDPYKQYRFGVAIAAAKGRKDPNDVGQDFQASSPWGENQIIVSYSNTIDDYIDDALKLVGLSSSDKKLISTPTSEESKDVDTRSPVADWMNKK
jgi:hypothetical protein